MNIEDTDRLPPERRFRLYMRIHEIAKEHDAPGLAETAMSQARQAVRESPELQREMRVYLDALRED